MKSRKIVGVGNASRAAVLVGGLFVLAAILTSGAFAGVPGQPRPAARDEICGTQVLHADGTYENGVINQEQWVMPPDFGAFAERFDGAAILCAITLDVTNNGSQWLPDPFDVFVCSDDGGIPGVVLAMINDVRMGMPANWPYWSRWRLELPEPCPVGERWWVGYWEQYAVNNFFLCADVDGPGGGRPMTKVRPGMEYPSGWQDIDVVFFPVAALGIGAEVLPAPTPVLESTWGRVKSLYR